MDQVKDQELGDANDEVKSGDHGMEEPKNTETENENLIHFSNQKGEEEEMIKKKYGGVLAKKKPLITKDHERAFFDSADWALGKQGEDRRKGPLEALRPKLQPTPHQQVRARFSACALAHDCDVDGMHPRSEDERPSTTPSIGDDKNTDLEEQKEMP